MDYRQSSANSESPEEMDELKRNICEKCEAELGTKMCQVPGEGERWLCCKGLIQCEFCARQGKPMFFATQEDLENIRDGNGGNGAKTNSMIHNFWSFIIQRLKDVAEEYGVRVEEVSEYKTSTTCPRCTSQNTVHAGRLFKCLNCRLEAHRDAVGALNMANLRLEGTAIGAVAHPLLLRWDEVGA